MFRHRLRRCWFVPGALLLGCFSCGEKSTSKGKSSYDFSAASSHKIESAALTGLTVDEASPFGLTAPSYSSLYCLTPSVLTGKYFGVGVLIQSDGNGMSAYFGRDEWSSITGTTQTYDFDMKSPFTNTANLQCCGGTGDLSSQNTYFSDVSYLFGYLDATFTISASSGARGAAIGTHTLRFVLADDVISGGKRGDLLYKDSAGNFKWMDSNSGLLSLIRPSSPVSQNTSVTNWVNPFGTSAGNQSIPVVYTGINLDPVTGGPKTVSEAQLKTEGATYTFNFDATNLVIFPGILANQDEGMLSTLKDVLQKVHLQGLPHSSNQLGAGPKTTLEIKYP